MAWSRRALSACYMHVYRANARPRAYATRHSHVFTRLGAQPSVTRCSCSVPESFWTLERGTGGERFVALTLAKRAMGYLSWEALLESDRPDTTIAQRVGLRIRIGDQPAGTVVVGLYGNVVPRTAANFAALAEGASPSPSSGVDLSYAGSP